MKGVYPVFIAQSGKDYLVYVPDFDIYTEGIKPTLTLLPNKTILEVKPYETHYILRI